MLPFLILLAMAGPPDLAEAVIALEETPAGLLFTDGRHRGLYLETEEGTATLSALPGAGGNVVVTGGGVLFKECPPRDHQRVAFVPPDGESMVLYRDEYFSGPFRCSNNSFLVAEPGRVLEVTMEGRIVREWPVNGYPASAAVSDGSLFYTGEFGGLEFLNISTGDVSIADGSGEIIFAEVTTGPDGLVLAEISPEGFMVLSPSGEIVSADSSGFFPSWTDDGEVIFSRLEYSGMEPVSGELLLLDPFSGEVRVALEDGAYLYPLETDDGDIVWTDDRGRLQGREAAAPARAPGESAYFDPDSHFDVVYMHQRWDTPDWFNGSWSCGPTSCVMATQYYLMLTPDSIWASYPSPGHWSQWGNYIPVEYTFLGYTYDDLGESPGGVWVPGAHGFICPNGAAVWNLMVEFLTRHDIYSAWAGTSWSALTGEINSLYPVVCSSTVLGYGHIILLNGYYANHTVVVNDPFGDANEPGWGSYYNGKDVLYDWPGYNNGHVQIGVSQLFYARAPVPADPDTLVDDCSRGFFKYADCRYWHRTGSGFQGNAWWTYSTGAPPDTCVAEWHPELPFEGDYAVSVYVPPDFSTATGIYRLHTASGIEDIYLDQGLYSDEWVGLGTYGLAFDSFLRLGDCTGTGGQYIAFDAALFSPAGTGTGGGTSASMGEIRIWPNPCGSMLNLRFPDPSSSMYVEFYDISGRLVLSTRSSGADDVFQLDLTDLCRGIYILRAWSGAGTPHSRMVTLVDD